MFPGYKAGAAYITMPDTTWTLRDANIFNANTGNVGIGTTNPIQKLTISGVSFASTTAQSNISSFLNGGLRISGSAANSQDAITYQSSGGGGAAIAFRRDSGWGTFMDFYTNNAASGGAITQAMTINNLGSVGIGTINPQARLHVNFPAAGSTIFQVGTGDGSSNVDINLGYNGYGWYWRYYGAGSGDNNELQLWSEGAGSTDQQAYGIKQSGKMTFYKDAFFNGRVGIGNTNPVVKLDFPLGTVTGDIINVRGGQIAGLNSTPTNSDHAVPLGYLQANYNATSTNFWGGSKAGNIWSGNTGNVGIGVTNPSAKLDVSGRTILRGTGYFTDNVVNYEYNNLFAADKKWTVTTEGFNGTANLFDARQETVQSCSALPCSITIDMGGLYHYWYAFSLAFNWGTGYAGSSNFTIEKFNDPDATGGCDTWTTVENVTNFSGTKYITTSNLDNHICRFRITFNNIVGSQGRIDLGEISAYQFYYSNDGPMVKRYGDTMYGGLSFNNVTNDITTPSSQHLSLMPGGFVGIGTANPGMKLHVEGGDIALTGGKALYSYGNGGPGITNSTWGNFYSTGGITRFLTSGSGTYASNIPNMSFDKYNGSGTTNLMTILSATGNIGIGNTNPGVKLDFPLGTVTGDIINVRGGQIAGLNSTPTNSDHAVPLGYLQANYNATSTNFWGGSLGGDIWSKNTGYIGIGTTTPAAKLEINGTDNKLRLSYDSTRNTDFLVNSLGNLLISPSNKKVYLGTSKKYTIWTDYTGSGELASGSFVGGSGLVSGEGTSFITDEGGASGVKQVFAYYTGTAWRSAIEFANTSAGVFGNLLLMKSGGNVGIGTTDPLAKLEIRGPRSATKDKLLLLSKYDYGTTSFYQSYGNNFYTSGKSLEIELESLPMLQLAVNNSGTDGKSVFPNGNVGIGTTTIDSKLVVSGGTGQVIDVKGGHIGGLNSTPVNNDQAVPLGYLQANYNATSTNFWGGSKTGNIWAANSGNVGIGTSNPLYKLDIHGTSTSGGIQTNVGINLKQVSSPTNTATYTVSSGGSVDVGTHYYSIVYYTAIGETSVSNRVAVTTTSGNQTVNITNIPVSNDSTVIGRKIFRSKLGEGSSYGWLVGTINNNTGTTFTDTAADSSLTDNSGFYAKVNTTNNFITVGGVKAMTLDANQTIFGKGAGSSITSGFNNVLLGANAGSSLTTGNGNVIIGHGNDGGASSSGSNILIGYVPFTGGGNYNVGIGQFVFSGNGSKQHNIAIGYNTANLISTGYGNNIIGSYAGQKIGTGGNNVIFGHYAAGFKGLDSSYNTVIGGSALYGSMSGDASRYNTAIGNSAGYGNTTGNYNTFLGYLSGYSNTSGNNNIFIGTFAGKYETGSNSVIVDNIDRLSELNSRNSSLIYGVTDTLISNQFLSLGGGGNVGIGTTTIDSKLVVSGGTGQVIDVKGGHIGGLNSTPVNNDQAVPLGYLQANYNATSTNFWGGSKTGNIWAANSGNVGIGLTAPNDKLSVKQASNYGYANTINNALAVYADNSAFKKIYFGFDTSLGSYGSGYIQAEYQGTARLPLLLNANGGNVGVGTTNPTATLHLSGASSYAPQTLALLKFTETTLNTTSAISQSSDGRLRLDSSSFVFTNIGAGNGQVYILPNTGEFQGFNRNIKFSTNSSILPVIFAPNNVEAMRILGDGNVGIGTTNPTIPGLEIYKQVNYGIGSLTTTNAVTAWNMNGQLKISNANAGNGIIIGASATANDRKAWIQSGHPDQQYANYVGTLSLNPFGGNVGISTSSPAVNLDFSGNVTGDVINVRGGQIAGLNSTPTNSDHAVPLGYLQANYNATSTNFWGGSKTGNIWAANSGNVGVGTTNPGAKLDIIGEYSSSSPAVRIIGSPDSGSYDVFQVYWRNISSKKLLGLRTVTGSDSIMSGVTEIEGLSKLSLTQVGDTSANSAISINSYNVLIGYSGGTNGGFFNVQANAPLVLKTNNIERIRIKNDGNVGIGTTTPANADGWARVLDVYGVSHAKSIVTTNSGIETGTYSHNTGFFGAPAGGIIGTRSNHPLSLITNAASRMTILANGNVAIGTTTATSSLLVVSGGTGQVIDVKGGHIGGLNSTPVNNDQAVPLGYLQANYNATSTNFWGGSKTGDIWAANSGNVGIGTSTAATKLHVVGNLRIGASTGDRYGEFTQSSVVGGPLNLSFGGTGTGSYLDIDQIHPYYGFLIHRSGNWGGQGIQSDGTFGISHGSNSKDIAFYSQNFSGETVRIKGDGKVGIGTSNPNNKLHIVDSSYNQYSLRLQASTNNYLDRWSGIGFSGESLNTKAAILFQSIGSSYSRGNLIFALNNEANQNNATTSDAVMTLTPSGKVGIGTTNPESKFHIYGDSPILTVQANTYSGVNANPSIFLKNTQANAGFKFYYDGASTGNTYFDNYFTSGSMVFRTAVGATPVTAMTIKNNANIIMGNKLTVYGSLASGSVQTEDIFSIIRGDAGPSWPEMVSFKLGRHTSGTLSPKSRLDINLKSTADSSLTADVNVMTLTDTGNVGIGRTMPESKLDFATSSIDVINVRGGQIAGLNSTPTNSDHAVPLGYLQANYNATSTNFWGGSKTGNIWAANSGNVGIGTTTPTWKLDVADNFRVFNSQAPTYSSYLKSNWSDADSFELGINNHKLITSGNYHFGTELRFWTADTQRMVINSAGNVGIGTVNPTALLSLGKSTYDNNPLAGFTTSQSAGGRLNIKVQTWGTGSDYGLTDAMTLAADSYDTKNINVGIGTTNPAVKLDIFDSKKPVDVNGYPILGITTGNYYEAGSYNPRYSIGFGGFEGVYYQSEIGFRRTNFNTNDLSGSLFFATADGGNQNAAPIDRMTITNSGNVGIGTTNPTSKLELVGSANDTISSANATAKIGGNAGDGSVSLNIGRLNGTPNYGVWMQAYRPTDDLTFQLLLNPKGGNVAIGTTTATSTLVVSGGTGQVIDVKGGHIGGLNSTPVNNDQAVPLGYLQANYNATSTNFWGGSKTGNIWAANSGNVGVGATNPQAKLDVRGSLLSFNGSGGTYHYRNVASISDGSPSITGALKIRMPKSWSNTMMSVTIRGYNYSSHGAWEAVVSGYNYSGSPSWVNASADIKGKAPFSSVRLAHDGTYNVIILGSTSTAWSYPKVDVTDFIAGHSNTEGWGSGWAMSFITDETGIAYVTGVSSPMFTSSTGNIGIGNTNPTYKLDVIGNARIGTASINMGFGESSGNSVYFGSLTNHPLKFVVNTNEYMRINTNGRVGIGTTDPGSSLFTVGGTTSNGPSTVATLGKSVAAGEAMALSLVNYATGATGNRVSIGFHNGNAWSPTGKIEVHQTYNTDSSMHFYTYGTSLLNRMTINNLGNVGIGTTNPGGRLTVAGGEGTYAAPNFGSANLGSINIINTTSDRRNAITFSSAGSSNAQAGIYVHQDNSAGTHMYFATTNSYATGPQARLTILNNGNVGIGTTTIGSTLVVSGGTGQVIDVKGGLIGGLSSTPYNPDHAVPLGYLQANYNATSTNFWGGSKSGDIWAANAGFVGVGTSSPLSKLNVVGDLRVNNGKIYLRDTTGFGDTNHYVDYDGTVDGIVINGYGGVSLGAQGTNILNVRNSGRVGIGVFDPSERLEVVGGTSNSLVYGALLSNKDTTNTGGSMVGLGFAVNNTTAPKAGVLFERTASYGLGNLYFSLSSVADNTTKAGKADAKMTILNNGNVGIGTTNPVAKTTINSPSSIPISLRDGFSSLRLEYNGGWNDGDSGSQITFAQRYSSGDSAIIRTGAIRGFKSYSTGSFAGGIQLLYQPVGNIDMLPGVTVNHSGNVGIGTTNPTGKLTVAANSDNLIFANASGVAKWDQYLSGDDLYFYDLAGSGQPQIVFKRGGSVGIGTTTIGSKLVVSGGTSQVIDVKGGLIGGLNSTPTNSDHAVPLGYLQANYNATSTNFWGGSLGGDIWSSNSGNVGIGTTAPVNKLDVKSALVNGIDWGIRSKNPYNNNSIGWGTGIKFENTDTSLNNWAGITSVSEADWSWNTGLAFYTGFQTSAVVTPTEKVRITGSGNVGIGTTTPSSKLHVYGTNPNLTIEDSGGSTVGIVFKNLYAGVVYAGSITNSWTGNGMIFTAPRDINQGGFRFKNYAGSELFVINSLSGNVGIGSIFNSTVTAGSKLSVVGNAAIGTNYATSSAPTNGLIVQGNVGIGNTSPAGILHVGTLAANNLLYSTSLGDLSVRYGTSNRVQLAQNVVDSFGAGQGSNGNGGIRLGNGTNFSYITGQGTELLLNPAVGNVAIGTTTTGSKLVVSGGTGQVIDVKGGLIGGLNSTPTNNDHAVPLGYLQANYNATSTNFWGGSKSGDIWAANQGFVGIGTTDPTVELEVAGNVIVGTITATGQSSINRLTVSEKLTVSTIDPLYKINGINYSTFAASFVGGVKEEVGGRLAINKQVGKEYQAVIDFDKEKVGTDLWVWRKVVDFNKDNVEVIITPYGSFSQAYYYISDNKIVFRSDRPGEISYRLTGKRFDWRKWPTKADDQTEKPSFIID